jgi:cytochrome c oxidase assembly protein subunit 15
MKSRMTKALGLLSLLIFLLIVVGGLVRNLGAGLSCPDWPLCQGRIIPQFDLKVFAEYFHRLFAASVSLLTIVLAFFIFSKKENRELRKPMTLALLLLLSQVILGGLTVLQLLKSEIVTLHLATGTLYFATVVFMTLRSRGTPNTPLSIVLGGIVSSHYAGLACPDFPTCWGSWWPVLEGLVGLQWFHRLGATVVFILVSTFGLKLFKSPNPGKGVLMWILLLTQVCLGVSYVLFRIAVPLSVTHLAVAEALFALVLISTYEIRYNKLR